MTLPFIDSEDFANLDFSTSNLKKAEYDNCTFSNCNFADSDLSSITFIECNFHTCNFSNANIKHSIFRDVTFTGCKLIGLQFQDCNPFLMAFCFNDCQLQLASFYKLKLKATKFNSCNLSQVNFTEADFSSAEFEKCNFQNAVFEGTNLLKADLSTSENFSINPESNTITKATFSKENVMGLLSHHQIVIV